MTPNYSLHMSTVFFSDFILQDVTVATFMIASSSWTKLKDSQTQTEQNEVSAIMIVKIIPQTVAILAVLYLKKSIPLIWMLYLLLFVVNVISLS